MTSRAAMFSPAIVALLLVAGCGAPGSQASSANRGAPLERTSEKGPVKLVVRITPQEPRLSDIVEMEIQVTAPPGIEVKPPSFGQAVGDFVIRDYTEKSETKTEKAGEGPNVRRFVYKLEPMSGGRHLIRSIAVEFVDNRPLSEQKGVKTEIETEPFEINVTSELGDQTPDLANLELMVPPQPLTQSAGSYWFLAVILVALMIGLSIWMLRRTKKGIVEPRRQTPAEIAHAALSALLSEDLPTKGQFKEFYLRLTGIVRHFIEGTTGLRAPEQTTEEFLRAMRSRDIFPVERSMRLKDFLEAADMVKYAGQQPDQDQIEIAISRAREFVDDRASASTEPAATAQGV